MDKMIDRIMDSLLGDYTSADRSIDNEPKVRKYSLKYSVSSLESLELIKKYAYEYMNKKNGMAG